VFQKSQVSCFVQMTSEIAVKESMIERYEKVMTELKEEVRNVLSYSKE
jgi:hypothetical protein